MTRMRTFSASWRTVVVALLSLGLAACASSGKTTVSHDEGVSNPPVVLPSKITAVGYGAMPTMDGLSPSQRRLLAMRASKLDAYRTLAETVSGVKITGNSTVSAMALNNDGFRAYVESYLRGARVVTVTPLPDGAFETTLEITLGGEFYRAAQTASHQSGGSEATPAAAPMKAVPQPVAMPVESAILPSQNFYLSL
ncbi:MULTISPECIES: LPP20 family lipoprotein [Chitinibacter]|uniref:LPP20 family lipoprotein n=1 Tax=Chitinibacter TaxID=230666 RepID=UPI00040BD6DE|nr:MULTISPECIES: LPP20 family lipoprotein [Chitinibacter]